ncbi:MAG TPA: peptidylprolyl isomerase [Pyrinomonadaceae bacterium]|jgi:cyclophilin family peptidyl-prolyl cis-trans isomerase
MKILKFILLPALFLTLFACSQNQSTGNKSGNKNAAVKKGVVPVADPEVAVIEMESGGAFGKITIELYSNVAPEAVKRFKELAREGFYNGTSFHRINATVIQGGDPLSKDADPSNDGTGQSDKPNVKAEFSDIPYDTGIVGAARSQDVDSANSQFFIMLKREPGFDNNYTVFGKVVDGMNNVKTIAGVPRSGERPMDDVKIKSVTIQSKQ